MTEIKKYGRFLSRLNQYGKIGKILKIDVKNQVRIKSEPISTVQISDFIKPAQQEKTDLLNNINSLFSDKGQFNATIQSALKCHYLINKKTKTSEYTFGMRNSLLDTVLNNEYTGIISNNKLIEIKKKSSRPITNDMEPPKEILNITPKLGKLERESYNHMIDFVIDRKYYFFSKKRGVGYSYGHSKDILAELINSDYFAIITTKNNLVEFVRKDIREISNNMDLPHWLKNKD